MESITGVPKDKIAEAARVYATQDPASIIYCMGITQHAHGTDNVLATANLAMLTGNIGKPSSGVNPLRGQNNVQGACDIGALPNVFPGYQKVIDEASRKKFGKAWKVKSLPEKNGLMIPQMMEGLVDKSVRGFYIFGENLANTEPDIRKVEHELALAQFMVVQDIFANETSRFADVVLPGDIVVGDADGVVVIPRVDAEDVWERAESLIEKEKRRIEEIDHGVLFKPVAGSEGQEL